MQRSLQCDQKLCTNSSYKERAVVGVEPRDESSFEPNCADTIPKVTAANNTTTRPTRARLALRRGAAE